MLKVRYVPLTPKFPFCSLLFALCKFAVKSDVIHAHFLYPSGLAAVLYKVLSRKPCVVTAHGEDILINESIGYGMRLSKTHDQMIKFVLKSADSVIAPSRLVFEEAIKAGTPASKIHIIPNGVDTEKFSPDRVNVNAAKDMLGLDATEHLVLTVANFRPVKGYRFLVEAIPLVLKNMPKTVFLFVGDGPEKPKIMHRVKQLGVSNKVIFVGSVSLELMPLYYAVADIFVLPSISESFSLTLLEAMASGKPIIATSTGAIPELVRDRVSELS
jgi:glycosyltransferase involved in cell wall biosynthesis